MGNLFQILFMIALPVAAGGYAAWFLRARLAGMRWNIYAFALMMGLLTPVLVGLLVAQAMIDHVETGMALAVPMLMGVSAGTGWLAGALMFRFNGSET
ncbi:hypothetical protein [Hyphobacterium sp.]|uniref:hypothetical protein n=1 Tax=Hyphobacterium sp. TaxID=2004662 RepID=UPI003B52BC73